MRLGIYTSGGEALPLFHFLKNSSYEVVLFVDRNVRPIDDKDEILRNESINRFFDEMEAKDVDAVILPPMVELALVGAGELDNQKLPVIPLYTTYLEDHVCKYTLVGKMGLLTEQIDSKNVQSLLSTQLAQSAHKPTQGRSRRTKQVPLRKYYQTQLGTKDWMVRKTIKTDIAYFKDAAIDTIIPTSWSHFGYQSIIKHLVSSKHMRFHGLSALEESFLKSTKIYATKQKESTGYSLDVVTHGDTSLLLEQKRRRLLLGIK